MSVTPTKLSSLSPDVEQHFSDHATFPWEEGCAGHVTQHSVIDVGLQTLVSDTGT